MAQPQSRAQPAVNEARSADATVLPPKLDTCVKLPEATDDDSEWEYEYSATETEVYYLTVDLSTPDFTARSDEHIVHNTRGGYRTWFNPLLEKPDINAMFGEGGDDGQTTKGPAGKRALSKNSHGKGDKEDEEDEEDDSDDENEGVDKDNPAAAVEAVDEPGASGGGIGSPESSRKLDHNQAQRRIKSKKNKKEEKPLQIQIIDLHTEQPIISHKGMVFKGTWSSNIGTELVFTEPLEEESETRKGTPAVDPPPGDYRISDSLLAPELRPARDLQEDAAAPGAANAEPQLPYLAAVPGATLLAASSARLQCVPISIQNRALPQQRAEAHRAARAANRFVIQVTDDLTGLRRPQGRFLEQLMAVKRRRGETDEVTVVTAENPDDAVEDDSEEDFEREKKERKRISGKVRTMRKKLQPADADAAHGPGRGAGFKPRIRRNKSTMRPTKDGSTPVRSSALSSPTPVTWDQMETGGEAANQGSMFENGE